MDSALTQIKEIVLTYKYTLLILTPTVPGPVLTSGEPLALWAFVSSPKQQQRAREGRPGFLLCPGARSLGDPATGKGLRGKAQGGVDVLGKAVCTWWKNRMERAVVEVRVRSCVALHLAPRRVKTSLCCGTAGLGAGSKLRRACGEWELLNNGVMCAARA